MEVTGLFKLSLIDQYLSRGHSSVWNCCQHWVIHCSENCRKWSLNSIWFDFGVVRLQSSPPNQPRGCGIYTSVSFPFQTIEYVRAFMTPKKPVFFHDRNCLFTLKTGWLSQGGQRVNVKAIFCNSFPQPAVLFTGLLRYLFVLTKVFSFFLSFRISKQFFM